MSRAIPPAKPIRVMLWFMVAVAVSTACTSPTESGEGTPGFSGSSSTISEEEFRLARPAESGAPTTSDPERPRLPEEVEEGVSGPQDNENGPAEGGGTESPEAGGTTSSDPPPPTAPTTTVVPVRLPEISGVTSICGVLDTLWNFFAASEPGQDRIVLIPQFLATMERYVEVAPVEMQPDVAAVAEAAQMVLQKFAEGGHRADYPPFRTTVDAFVNYQPPFENLLDQMVRINAYERRTC